MNTRQKDRISAALTAVLMIIATLSAVFLYSGLVQVRAEAAYLVMDIVSPKKVIRNYVIEEDEIIYVRNGGTFTVAEDVTLTVKGRLKVAQGGVLNVRGNIKIDDDGLTSVSGRLNIVSSGSVTINGRLWINKNGVAQGKGVIEVTDKFSDIVCKGTVKTPIQPPKPIDKNGITYVGGVLIVNKQYSLPQSYGDGIVPAAYSAYVKMKQASGYAMSIVSGFRSYEKQQSTFDYWCSIDGYDKAVTYSAKPGESEHQTGLAMDITSLNQSYGNTAEGRWLAENCHKYGFIIRYPKGKDEITGYMYEPWHIRYLGTSTAKLVYDSGLTLEEFLGVD